MINILKIFIIKLFSMLPDSPFTTYFESVDWSFYDYLNWFLPIDICSNMLLAWLVCMMVYYIWEATLKKLIDFVLEKLLPLIIEFFI